VDIVSICGYCSVNSCKVIQSACHVAATHNQVLTTPEWVIAAPEWVILAAPERVIAAPEWVIAAPERVILAAPEWVIIAPERVIAAPEWVIVAAPEWLNRVYPCRMNGTNSNTIIKLILPSVEYSTAYYMFKSIFTDMMLLIFLPAYDSCQNLMDSPLLKDSVAIYEQYCIACNQMQPTSQYSIYEMQGQFLQFATVHHNPLFPEEVISVLLQHFYQCRTVQLIVFILSWCHEVLSILYEKQVLMLSFDPSVHVRCVQIHLMLTRFKHRKHDFAVYVSGKYLIIPQYNGALFLVTYLENIVSQIGSCWKHKKIQAHNTTCPVLTNGRLYHNIHSSGHFDKPLSALEDEFQHAVPIGGGVLDSSFTFDEINPFIVSLCTSDLKTQSFKYVDHLKQCEAVVKYNSNKSLLCQIPFQNLGPKLSVHQLRVIARQHNIFISARASKSNIMQHLNIYNNTHCNNHVSVFEPYHNSHNNTSRSYQHTENISKCEINDVVEVSQSQDICHTDLTCSSFPPSPPSATLRKKIIKNFCEATAPSNFQEAGCAVCGALILMSNLTPIDHLNCKLDHLMAFGLGFTWMERKKSSDPICELGGPIMDQDCRYICKSCKETVIRGRIPKFALARGLWLGKVPNELQDLSFAEKLLIGRIRHNRCIVRVAKGMLKMIANAVTFEHPMQKIYTVLPPPVEEMDEVLAFIFTGPCQPTEDDFRRIPLLVRRNKVAKALEWLKLNHSDYADLEISYKNLESYPEDSPPVVINYRYSVTNKIPEATSVHDMELENGTEEGACPFTVHTLTSEEYDTMNSETLKAMAAKHLDDGGKVLAIGHSKEPQSIWKNPKLYPQMFPWLFPYGLGGIGHERQRHKLSDAEHKRHLLLYHDKRFQKDPYFPLIAFNHEQIKDSTTSGFILAKQKSFENIANRLLGINSEVLADITERMIKGERIKGESTDEKDCLQLIHDLDRIGGHVKGSITSKKYMRNEIWSLISFHGAPSWYITLSPADNKHPISLYYADTNEKFTPVIRSKTEKDSLIADNPVASARFFHFMIQAFIKHILGVDADHPGLYGDTSSYYGTVEQQGRLTLHLHMLLWIRGALTPQEIRDRIMDPESDFQKKMVEYLESVHMGEFITGSLEDVKKNVDIAELDDKYKNPTETLPIPPPPQCNQNECGKCKYCKAIGSWQTQFNTTVDDILF